MSRWQKKFDWAQYDAEKDTVTCSVCTKAGKTNDYVRGKSRPGKGWRKEYLNRHRLTEPLMAVQARQVYDHVLSESGKETIFLMKNVYFLARECIAVLKAKKLHKHVQELGCKVPTSHQGLYSSWEFVSAISQHLEQDLLKQLKSSPFFSLGDESTDIAVQKNLILYVKYLSKGQVHLSFLKLLKLERADATHIYESIVNYFAESHVDISRMVMWTSDGAEVMLGKYGGVQAKLKV